MPHVVIKLNPSCYQSIRIPYKNAEIKTEIYVDSNYPNRFIFSGDRNDLFNNTLQADRLKPRKRHEINFCLILNIKCYLPVIQVTLNLMQAALPDEKNEKLPIFRNKR